MMKRVHIYLFLLLCTGLLCGCRGKHRQASASLSAADTTGAVLSADTVVPPSHTAKSRTALYLDSLGFVNIAEADRTIAIDLMYTRADNFTGAILYDDLKEAYLHPEALESLQKAQRLLKAQHPAYSLIVYDAARPMSVQQKM